MHINKKIEAPQIMAEEKLIGNLSELAIPPLNPKQASALISPANEILYGGAVLGGKDLSVDTPILTTDGFKTMRDVRVGDFVYNEKGLPTKVVAESEIFKDKNVYKITFDDGTSINASDTHQWETQDYRERESNRRRTKEFRERRKLKRQKLGKGVRPDLAELNSSREYQYDNEVKSTVRTTKEIHDTLLHKGKFSHIIINSDPLIFSKSDLPLHPYVLGAWLGDGSRNQTYITSADEELVEYIKKLGYSIYKVNERYLYGIGGLFPILKNLGIASVKRIPDIYKFSSVEDRLELVRGLMDTDGTISKDGKISIGLADKELIDDLVFVLNSLGIKVFRNQKKRCLYGVRKKDSFTASFSTDLRVFNLSRKLERVSTKLCGTEKYRSIRSVEPIESVPTKCIQVDSDSHLFLAGEQLVPTHNSHLLRVASIIYAALVPGINIYLFRRLTRDLVLNHFHGAFSYHVLLGPWVDSGYVQIINSAPYEIRFGNGSRIFLNHLQYLKTMYSFQGAEVHVALFDEGTHILPEQYEFIRSRVRLGGLSIDIPRITKVFNDMISGWGIDHQVTEREMQTYFPRMIIGTNPGGIGHQFYKDNFVDAAPPFKIWKTPKLQGGMYRQFIPSRYVDNEYAMKLDPDYIDRVRGIGDPELATAMIEGDWNIISGGVFNGVWDDAVHFIEPFEIPDSWYLDRTFDWGSAKPFATCYWAESNGDDVILADGSIGHFPKGTLFLIQEDYGSKTGELNKGLELSSYEIGERMAKIELATPYHERIKAGPADSSIFDLTKFRDEYTSIHEEIKHGYNSVYYQSEQRRRGELFVPADKSPGSRIRGLEVMRTMLKSAKQEPLEDKALFIFNTCTNFKKTVPNLQRDEKNLEDVDTDGIDHIYDAVRYRVLTKKVDIKKLSNYLGG